MKNRMKKLAMVAAVVVMLAVVFCFGASAYDTYGDFSYSEEYGEITIEECDYNVKGMVIIPEEINGLPVTTIGSFAFDGCNLMTGVVIPESVDTIEDYAFDTCTKLKTVILDGDFNLNNTVFYYCNAIEKIYISDDIGFITEDAFYYGYGNERSDITVYYEGSVYDWEDASYELEFEKIVYNHKHSYKKDVDKATLGKAGKIYKVCECGAEEASVIPAIDKISIPYTVYTYNGKAKTPTVTVKDTAGKTLKKGTDYKVAYSSGRTKPGKYNVRVVFKGNYEGEKVLSFKVLPGKTSKITTSATANSVTLKWSKVAGAAGYRVYVYDKSTGSFKKLATTTSNKYTAKGLNDSTTYKFKVLAYAKSGKTTFWAEKFTTVKATTKKAVKLTLNAEKVSLYLGKSKAIKATTYPTGVTVKWKSSNTAVAKVSSKGTIVAVKAGTAKITAYFTYKNKTYKDVCTVNVLNPSLTLSKTSATVNLYDSLSLKATAKPSGVTVKWKSSNTAVAKVSSKGTVVPVKTGTATITAYFTYMNKTYQKSCVVTVKYQDPITITYVDWYTNSAYGVEPEITIRNNTNKDIKYIEIETGYRNRYGDPAYCEIRGDYTRTLLIESGLAAKETRTFYWGPAVYHPNVHRIDIDTISVTFVDNTVAELEPYVYWYDSYYYYQ